MLASIAAVALATAATAMAGDHDWTNIPAFSFPANTRFSSYRKGNCGNFTIRTWPELPGANTSLPIFPAKIESKLLGGNSEQLKEAVWGSGGVFAPDLCGQILVTPRQRANASDPGYNQTSGMPFGAYAEQLLRIPNQPDQVWSWEMKYDVNTGRFWDDVDERAYAINIIFAEKDLSYYQTGNLTYSHNC